MWNRPCSTAWTTSSDSIRLATFAAGIATPWRPVSPRAWQVWKNPSILWVTPPTAFTSPRWSTEPVIVRRRPGRGGAGEVVADRPGPAGTGGAGQEEVVAGRAHLHAELDRLEDPGLADQGGQRLDLG